MRAFIITWFCLLTFGLAGQEIEAWSDPVFYNMQISSSGMSSNAIVGESEVINVAIGEKLPEEPKVEEVVLQQEIIVEGTPTTEPLVQTNVTNVDLSNQGLANDSLYGVKVALVIGNANYTKNAVLKNPINDANSIDSALQAINFKVIKVLDADYNTMRKAVSMFGKEARDADVAFFYFAGHGLQVDGTNYLIPLNANIETKEQVALECLSTELVLKTLEMTSSKSRLNVMVLDACRNNPFESWSRSSGSGLSAVTPPNGTLVAYATSPGKTAADGSGGNGLYTGELIKQLGTHQRIEDVFINTRVEVEEKSHGQQSPWELARLRGKYFLK